MKICDRCKHKNDILKISRENGIVRTEVHFIEFRDSLGKLMHLVSVCPQECEHCLHAIKKSKEFVKRK